MTLDFEVANWQEIFESAYDGMIAINRKREIVLFNQKG